MKRASLNLMFSGVLVANIFLLALFSWVIVHFIIKYW